MLKTVVHRIVHDSLSKYVQDIDDSELQVGLWDGEVKLSNLKVRFVGKKQQRELNIDCCRSERKHWMNCNYHYKS